MIGYKAFDENLCCRGFQFEVGKTYETGAKPEDMKLCTDTVFHFCRDVFDIECTSNYTLKTSRLCEVFADDVVFDTGMHKIGTNKLTVLREITGAEKVVLINSNYKNTGDYNTGSYNTGSYNTGSWNTGERNAGHNNTGDCNTGRHNSGNLNVGDWNAGYNNTGNYNTGSYNTGSWNIGNYNTGVCNAGNSNSGNWNTGEWNAGNYNTGCFNLGDWNTGYFNTGYPKTIRMFNKEVDLEKYDLEFPDFLHFSLTQWVSADKATAEEKKQHKQELSTMAGFLRRLEYKEAFRIAWDKADVSEHKKLLALPNWNNKIFKEISGIDAEAEIAKEEAEV